MIEYTPTPDFYNDYICHYGVKGMKWGKHIKIKPDAKEGLSDAYKQLANMSDEEYYNRLSKVKLTKKSGGKSSSSTGSKEKKGSSGKSSSSSSGEKKSAAKSESSSEKSEKKEATTTPKVTLSNLKNEAHKNDQPEKKTPTPANTLTDDSEVKKAKRRELLKIWVKRGTRLS